MSNNKVWKIVIVLTSILTILMPTLAYSVVGLSFIPFMGGIYTLIVCFKKKEKATTKFYIMLVIINIFLWILPMLVLIGYAVIMGDFRSNLFK